MSAGDRRNARVVVCALEGSAADGNALEVATQLARLAGARLALVAVVPVWSDRHQESRLQSWTFHEARRALEFTADALQDRVDLDCYLDYGNPVRRLAELAARKCTLLLVVGTPSGVSEQPSSIVASGVSRSARCPVVVVPEGACVPELDPSQPGPNP